QFNIPRAEAWAAESSLRSSRAGQGDRHGNVSSAVLSVGRAYAQFHARSWGVRRCAAFSLARDQATRSRTRRRTLSARTATSHLDRAWPTDAADIDPMQRE